MTGTCDNIQPAAFRYGRYLYVTWGYMALELGGYEFQYVELPAGATMEQVEAAVIEAGGDWEEMKSEIEEVEDDI